MSGTPGASDIDQSTLQLVIDQVEELLVTVIEEVRERPSVALAILAAIGGAIIGTVLAKRGKRSHARRGVGKRARKAGNVAEIAGLGVKLFENPMVRSYVIGLVANKARKSR